MARGPTSGNLSHLTAFPLRRYGFDIELASYFLWRDASPNSFSLGFFCRLTAIEIRVRLATPRQLYSSAAPK